MSFYIWQGFDHYWQREPHRLNRCGSYVTTNESKDHSGASYCSIMQIGRFPPDICHTHSIVQRAGNSSTSSIEGSCTQQLGGKLGEAVRVEGERVTVRLPDGHTQGTVILRGFEIESSFSHGFHTRGFGFQVADIRHNAAEVSFIPCYYIFPDRSPDPTTNPDYLLWKILPFPAAVEPRTPDTFEYNMTLHYAVISDQRARIHFSYEDIFSGPIRSRYVGPGAGRVVTPCTFQGASDNQYASASVGIRGFKWELLPWDRTRYDGRYLRKIQFMFDGLDYDPASGLLTAVPKMEFNNFGGQHGREQVNRWLDILRARRKTTKGFWRAVARSLRGMHGFNVTYDMQITMLQFVEGNISPPGYLYNRLHKNSIASRVIASQ